LFFYSGNEIDMAGDMANSSDTHTPNTYTAASNIYIEKKKLKNKIQIDNPKYRADKSTCKVSPIYTVHSTVYINSCCVYSLYACVPYL
jgi:hypothetical protein